MSLTNLEQLRNMKAATEVAITWAEATAEQWRERLTAMERFLSEPEEELIKGEVWVASAIQDHRLKGNQVGMGITFVLNSEKKLSNGAPASVMKGNYFFSVDANGKLQLLEDLSRITVARNPK